MKSPNWRWILAGLIAVSLANAGGAQTPPLAGAEPTEESTYFDLRRSKDRLTRQTAERYFNLVKLQEWSSAAGKKIPAKYVSHDANLKWVKLSVAKGSGKNRVVTELNVNLTQLSKTCQSRVKQIATLQKKLDEMAAAETAAPETGQGEAGEIPGGDPGAPMIDERGVEPRRPRERNGSREEREPQANVQPAVPESPPVDEGDTDPLGFGDLPVQSPAPGPAAIQPVLVGEFAVPAVPVPPGAAPAHWTTNYESFHANLRVGTDVRGESHVDFGEMRELQALSEAAANRPAGDREREKGQASDESQSLEVQWEAAFQGVRETPDAAPIIELELQPLPQPIQLQVRLEETNGAPNVQDWAKFTAGERIKFKGRLQMESSTELVVYVREPESANAGASETAREER